MIRWTDSKFFKQINFEKLRYGLVQEIKATVNHSGKTVEHWYIMGPYMSNMGSSTLNKLLAFDPNNKNIIVYLSSEFENYKWFDLHAIE